MNEGQKRIWKILGICFVLLAVGLASVACQSSEPPNASADVSRTPRPADAKLPALPTNTHTPAPSPTSVPSSTSTAEPPTSTPTETPTLTPTLAVGIYPTLSPDMCPLTGLQVSDPALLERRPLAIKVQNAAISRPQYGLPQADIVYEHLSEAAITRFTAIYLCQEVTKIGSTRSARFIDLEIPAMYRSLMAFSGTSAGLYPLFLNADFYDRQFCYGWGLHSEGFYRDKELRAQGIPIEHTLFADPNKIWDIATELGINEHQDLQGMDFYSAPPEDGQPAAQIQIPFPSRDMVVEWRYDAASESYLRWQAGVPHLDAASGEQLTATNVVVAYVTHVDSDIYEDEPRRNHPSVQIQLWGTGPAVVFRDGQAFEGLWARPKRENMLVFRDATGQIPIPLKPGNTWIELVPLPGHRWSLEATWKAAE
ncbi:MAG TPA: DUF3048 domain-containing protein [Anaerolineae bacterium]|nr:DUF3048 domain-containing protein [Anaerolineae bacterium]